MHLTSNYKLQTCYPCFNPPNNELLCGANKHPMKKILLFFVLALVSTLLYAQTTAIQNVNMIDVRTGKVLANTTILINGSTIGMTGQGIKFKLPAGTQVVDGTG